jgi:hypothetical protein
MKNVSNAILAAALIGSATLAAAQTTAERFADQYRTWQSYSSSSIPWQLKSPVASNTGPASAQASPRHLPFEYYQTLSANSDVFNRSAPSFSDHAPLFARSRSESFSFEYYQAIAAHSDVFKFAPDAGQPAFATAPRAPVAVRETPAMQASRK